MAGELDAGLIAEYEAIFTYGDAGPHLSDVQAETARTAEERHRDMRDAVLTWLHTPNTNLRPCNRCTNSPSIPSTLTARRGDPSSGTTVCAGLAFGAGRHRRRVPWPGGAGDVGKRGVFGALA